MSFYVMVLIHVDGDDWNTHVAAHVEHLRQLFQTGELRTFGPMMGGPHRSGLLIFKAANRVSVEELMTRDPVRDQWSDHVDDHHRMRSAPGRLRRGVHRAG